MNRPFIIIITCLIIIILICIYGQYSLRVNPIFELMYVSIEDFDHHMLYEKNPLIISEPLVEPKKVLPKLIGFFAPFEKRYILPTSEEKELRGKITAVIATQDGQKLQMKHNRLEKSAFTLVMKKNQVILIPRLWKIESEDGTLQLIRFDDVFTTFV